MCVQKNIIRTKIMMMKLLIGVWENDRPRPSPVAVDSQSTDTGGALLLLTYGRVGERGVTPMSPNVCWRLTREDTTLARGRDVLNTPYRGPHQVTLHNNNNYIQ